MRAVSRRLAASFCRSAVTCASSSTIGVLPDFSRVSISPRTLRTVVRATLLRSFMWLTTSACRRSFRVVIVLLVSLSRLTAEPVGPGHRKNPVGVLVSDGANLKRGWPAGERYRRQACPAGGRRCRLLAGGEDAGDCVVFRPGHPEPVLGLHGGLPGDILAPERL